MVFLIIPAVCAVLILLYLLSLSAGNGRKDSMRTFWNVPIAHRGLFNNRDIPENSLPAFQKAVDAGYGIELDVQMTADGKLVVFHDANLKRMCGINKDLTDLSLKELQKLHLLETGILIPLLEEALRVINGRVPLIVEIKQEGNRKETTRKTAAMLDRYQGEFCVESFHPLIVYWFKKNRPHVIRGQLSTDYFMEKVKLNPLVKFVLTNMMMNWLTRPDFIAYRHTCSKKLSFRICKKLYPVVCAAWTVKSMEEWKSASEDFQIMIFDSFIPPSI